MTPTDVDAPDQLPERQRDAHTPPSDESLGVQPGGDNAEEERGGTPGAPAPAHEGGQESPALHARASATGSPTCGDGGGRPPARRELTVVLTLIPARDDAGLRACYSVGGAETPYPVMSTLAAADAAWAAAQIPGRIAEAEARWLAQPSLPRATTGATAARPTTPPTARPTTTRNAKSKAVDKGGKRGQGAPDNDNARLAAALLRDTPVPATPSASGPHAGAAPGIAAATEEPAAATDMATPAPTTPAWPATKATPGGQLSLFG